jgi:hypothetical protein
MSEIQSIAQNNYILQAPPPTATMFTTELEYDGDKISGYAGSAFKAGTDLEFGYTDADTISSINNSAITDVSLNNIVQTNSGAWGGSALPVSAGPGVKLQLVNNTLVVSNDETVLYNDLTGRPTTVGSYIDLSESPLNFYYIGIYLNGSTPTGSNNISNGYEKVPVEQLSSSNGLEFLKEFVGTVAGNISTVHDMGCGYSGTSGTRWTKWYGYSYNVQNKNVDFDNNTHLNIWKVVGINRKH